MIHLLYGENTYARDRALADILEGKEPEHVDGSTLETRELPDLLAGQTLFSNQRLIVIRDIIGNGPVWSDLEKYIENVPDTTTLILVDGKPDKRTRTYKLLQKQAQVKEFTLPKNAAEAIRLTLEEARNRDLKLDRASAGLIVARVGLGPWDIVHALEKLLVLGNSDRLTIERVIDASPSEQVFGLFEASLSGKTKRVREMCLTLSLGEDPYRVMGLLSGQVTQLAALVLAGRDADVAADLGVHWYAVDQLCPIARKVSRADLQRIVEALATADEQMKSTGEQPWLLIEQALQKIATR